jgi:hypothetical protein
VRPEPDAGPLVANVPVFLGRPAYPAGYPIFDRILEFAPQSTLAAELDGFLGLTEKQEQQHETDKSNAGARDPAARPKPGCGKTHSRPS